MNSFYKKTGMSLGMLILWTSAFAQAKCERVEMADGMYQSGKIYVVVTVLSVIFIGIVGYLIMLDRKISKLEKEIENK
jgi:CcmD family protein